MSKKTEKEWYHLRVLLWDSKQYDFGQSSKKAKYFLQLPHNFLTSPLFYTLTGGQFKLLMTVLRTTSECNQSDIKLHRTDIRRTLNSHRTDIEHTLNILKRLQVIEIIEGENAINKEINKEINKGNKKKSSLKSNDLIPFSLESLWNDKLAHVLSKVIIPVSSSRKKKIIARLKDHPSEQDWIRVMKKISDSNFLTGQNDRGWKANFDWLLRPETFAKVLEGQYDNPETSEDKLKRLLTNEAFEVDTQPMKEIKK